MAFVYLLGDAGQDNVFQNRIIRGKRNDPK